MINNFFNPKEKDSKKAPLHKNIRCSEEHATIKKIQTVLFPTL